MKDRGAIEELWVSNIDRIGRECRKLMYFFLEFCIGGAKIRTPEKTYDLKDLSNLLMLVIEAHAAEQTNKSRAAAAVAGKRQAFKQKRWNKTVPSGYKKEIWLEKLAEWKPLVKEAYAFFLDTKCIETVRTHINQKYKYFLSNPLSRSRVRSMLSDPVYVGRPQHVGETIFDPSLSFVDEESYDKVQGILVGFSKSKSRKIGPIENLARSNPSAVWDFLKQFEVKHRGCCGRITKNGTTRDCGEWQQLLICNKCGKEWRYPLIRQTNSRRSDATSYRNIGNLVFEKLHPDIAKKSRKNRTVCRKRRNSSEGSKISLLDFLVGE